jgi:dTDP-4-amino-4,6-dideoxygalactose transaminase
MGSPATKPVRKEFLPFSKPTIGEEEINEVVEVLRSGWITTGPRAQKFEELCRDYTGAKHALALSSATAGLHISLLALGIQPGDEVILPSMTFAATANAVEWAGATPVFVDVNRDTLLLDMEAVEEAVTERTRAIMPVHYAGQPVDLDTLREICEERGLLLVEDAAHAIGTRYKDERIGEKSHTAIFSFHPIKNITTGEGGLITTDDEELANKLRLYRFHGMSKDAWKRYDRTGSPHYDIVLPGFKYNFMDIQAALGIHQLAKLEGFIERRTQLAEKYDKAFAEIPGITPLKCAEYPMRHAWHLYVVRIDKEKLGADRDEFMTLLKEHNIGSGLHFEALHLHPYYKNKYPEWQGKLPNTEWNSARIVSLPLFPLMTDGDADDVIAACRAIAEKHRR